MTLDIKSFKQIQPQKERSIAFLKKSTVTEPVSLKVGPGLNNAGNTCYLNSVLQCLSYTKSLVKLCHSTEHPNHCQLAKTHKFCSMCSMIEHIKSVNNSRSSFTPKPFVQNLKLIAKHFRPYRQEDSHEFLRFLVDGMHNSLNGKKKTKSDIERIFGGKIRSQIKCLHCNSLSNTNDPILDLSLDIRNCGSIEHALKRYTAIETLNKDNQYKCEKCNHLRDAEKRITIDSLPQTLVIHVKRFDFGRKGTKINRHISFTETLNVSPYVSSDKKGQGNIEYELFGVNMHAGHSCNSGHYYSFIKSSDGNWYKMDDSSVKPVPISSVLQQAGYMFFYQRKSEKKSHTAPADVKVKTTKPAPVEQDVAPKPTKLFSTISWTTKPLTEISLIPDNKINSTLPSTTIQTTKLSKTQEFLSDLESTKKTKKERAQKQKNDKKQEDSIENQKLNTVANGHVKHSNVKRNPSIDKSNVDKTTTLDPVPNDKALHSVSNHKNGKKHKQKENYEVEEIQTDSPSSGYKEPFKMAVLNSSNGLTPWNHIATSDKVFERNKYQNHFEQQKKRKRASRDDMIYDAPLLKGLKKVAYFN
ncbi:hypothetical protein HDV02_003217 [Globomyces sp. JEL0801]|nr:hypothetical protein HDV02_003217 [Globomyces sp. JEL0801]